MYRRESSNFTQHFLLCHVTTRNRSHPCEGKLSEPEQHNASVPRVAALGSGQRHFTPLEAEQLREGSAGLAPGVTPPSCDSDPNRRARTPDSGCQGCVHAAVRRTNCTMGWGATAEQTQKNRDFGPGCTSPPRAAGEQLVPVFPNLCYVASWIRLTEVSLGASCWPAATLPTTAQTASVHTDKV